VLVLVEYVLVGGGVRVVEEGRWRRGGEGLVPRIGAVSKRDPRWGGNGKRCGDVREIREEGRERNKRVSPMTCWAMYEVGLIISCLTKCSSVR